MKKLAFLPVPERCSYLGSNGRRCRAWARAETFYHGDSEIYTNRDVEAQWVRVAFCDKHMEPFQSSEKRG